MKDIDESKAPLLEHLVELRRRLLRCVLALALGFAVCYYFSNEIFGFLVQPVREGFGDKGGTLIFTKLYEAFFVHVKVGLFGSFVICFPVIANQLWAFIAPGLYTKEKRALFPFLLATPVLFLMGAALAYYVVTPTAFGFFLGYQGTIGDMKVEAMPSMDSYLTLVMQFVLAFGISFLMPVLLMLLNRAGIVTRAQLVAARRYAWVGAFIVAAVLTPPDVASQCMLAIPLIMLYEITLIAIWFTDRRNKGSDETDEADQDVAVAE